MSMHYLLRSEIGSARAGGWVDGGCVCVCMRDVGVMLMRKVSGRGGRSKEDVNITKIKTNHRAGRVPAE